MIIPPGTFTPEFYRTALNNVINSGLLAAVATFLGFVASRALERFKSREAYIGSFTQVRIKKVAEIWELVYRWENQIEHARQKARLLPAEDWNQTLAELRSELAVSDAMSSEIRSLVEMHRFWLGEAGYKHFINYHNLLHPYLEAICLRERDCLTEMKYKLDKKKQSVLTMLRSSLS